MRSTFSRYSSASDGEISFSFGIPSRLDGSDTSNTWEKRANLLGPVCSYSGLPSISVKGCFPAMDLRSAIPALTHQGSHTRIHLPVIMANTIATTVTSHPSQPIQRCTANVLFDGPLLRDAGLISDAAARQGRRGGGGTVVHRRLRTNCAGPCLPTSRTKHKGYERRGLISRRPPPLASAFAFIFRAAAGRATTISSSTATDPPRLARARMFACLCAKLLISPGTNTWWSRCSCNF